MSVLMVVVFFVNGEPVVNPQFPPVRTLSYESCRKEKYEFERFLRMNPSIYPHTVLCGTKKELNEWYDKQMTNRDGDLL